MVAALSVGLWVGWSHFDRVADSTATDTPAALGVLDSAMGAATAHPHDQISATGTTSGPLDEHGGLITPHGLILGTEPTTIDNRLLFIGDSVMQATAPTLPDLAPKWSVVVDTRVGRFLDEAITVLKKRAKQDLGQIVVLNLGNNYNGDQATFSSQVDEMMGELLNVRHVIWINSGEYEKKQQEVNATLLAAAQKFPKLVIADWNGLWEDHANYTGYDSLHLTPAGTTAYAQMMLTAIDRVTTAAKESPASGVNRAVVNSSGSIPVNTPRASHRPAGGTNRRSSSASTSGPSDPSGTSGTSGGSTGTANGPAGTDPTAARGGSGTSPSGSGSSAGGSGTSNDAGGAGSAPSPTVGRSDPPAGVSG